MEARRCRDLTPLLVCCHPVGRASAVTPSKSLLQSPFGLAPPVVLPLALAGAPLHRSYTQPEQLVTAAAGPRLALQELSELSLREETAW